MFSMLSYGHFSNVGESMPVSKGPGDPVFGGTINHNGSIIMQTHRVGGDTTLAQIIKLGRVD